MRYVIYVVIIASLLLIGGIAIAQTYGTGQQFPQQTPYDTSYQPSQQGGVQQPAYQPTYQPPAAVPTKSANISPGLDLPAPPDKPVPNMTYGNSNRAAIIGEMLSKSSQGNANVYVKENSNNTISIGVYLMTDSDPYSLAGTLANLTYMVNSVYGLTDKAASDILLTAYDTSGNVVTTAKFSNARNAFDYFRVPETASMKPTQQPAYPSNGQPSYGGQYGSMGQYGNG